MTDLPDFAPAPASTRRDYVAETLRRSILAGRIAPGTQLVESRLSAQFGVSRGLLREAVRELIETGLLINRPYAGTFVAEINEAILADVYELRHLMERRAFERVWPLRDRAFADEMRARFAALAASLESGDLAQQSAAESRFHGLVYEACTNRLLLDFWRQMTQKIQLGFAICQIVHAPKPNFLDNHRRFMTLALGDDLQAMLAELDAHLERGLATIRHGA